MTKMSPAKAFSGAGLTEDAASGAGLDLDFRTR